MQLPHFIVTYWETQPAAKKMRRVTLFLLCCVFALAAGQECYDDWHYHEGSCYGFGEESVSWGEAQEICEAFGSRLAEIANSEENEWLKTMCRASGATNCWLGGSDIFHEGSWVWASTRSEIYPFTDWAAGQPSNGGDLGHEDCLSFFVSVDYKWNDAACVHEYPFICETRYGSYMTVCAMSTAHLRQWLAKLEPSGQGRDSLLEHLTD